MFALGEAALAFAGVSTFFVLVIYGISWLVRPMPHHEEGEETYECGMPAEGKHRGLGFNYLQFAVLFLVFDLAALFLFLYAMQDTYAIDALVPFGLGIATLCIMILYGTRARRYHVS